MNIASWLARSALSHPALPAAATGTRVVATYGQLAERAARLAGALRERCGLEPGDRVAIAAKNSPAYLEVLYGIWHAGLAAVPANAKLHGAELGYILEQSGARVCFASDGIDADIAPHAPKSLERLITIGGADYEALFTADPIALVPRAPGDLAWLFYTSGTTGRPKGAMLTHDNLVMASLAYGSEVDPVTPGDAILHAAPMSHGSGLYIMQHVARLGVQVIAGERRLRAGGDRRAVQCLAAHVDVRGADHDQAPGRLSGRSQRREHPHADLGRRADVCRGCARSARPLRAAAGADLRAGRSADDHHHAVEAGHRRPRSSALARAPGLGRQALCLRRGDGGGPAGQAGGAGRGRRDPLPRRRSCPAIGKIRRQPRPRCATAGCTPATSACSTKKAICTSRTAPRT